MAKELDESKDVQIDIDNLQKEFRTFPSTFYGYTEIKAKAEEDFDLKKAEYEELRSEKYIEFKSREGKVTEKHVEAMIEVDKDVKQALRTMLEAKRDLETIKGYVESLRAKKDMLIQLGADARKE